jgi:DNA polymerase-3 subunit gamma/tau
MVFYRKYRPQTIEELDSEDVKTSLHSVLSSKTIPHAFLFTGPKGLGKTSTARIVAKYVNCTAEKGEKPCNKCEQCISITNGTNVDILEIDGASNRGIDEMRDLREKIRLLPVSAKMKVYIIDEVHMLTTEAFNALLKTLEEPPSHAMFILCTTEPHKVPGTILSRCFHIQFKKATSKELVASFERIMKGEKITADKDALEMIASFADGSFRDGAKIMEELTLTLGGKKLTKEAVDTSYHISTIDHDIATFLQSLLDKDTKKGLSIIQHISEIGIDIKYFTEQLLLALHHLLLQKVDIIEGKQIVDIDIATIRELANVFGKAYAEMKYAVLPQLPLELAVVEWGEETEELRIKNYELRGSTQGKKDDQSPNNNKQIISPLANSASDKTFLYQLLDSVKAENHMLAGVLRSCKIHNNDGVILIETPSVFHKERLETKTALQFLEKICENITGKPVKISIVLK